MHVAVWLGQMPGRSMTGTGVPRELTGTYIAYQLLQLCQLYYGYGRSIVDFGLCSIELLTVST